MKIAPCKGCLDRAVGCHTTCKKYLAYVAENTRVSEERAKWEATEAAIIDMAIRRKKRGRNRR